MIFYFKSLQLLDYGWNGPLNVLNGKAILDCLRWNSNFECIKFDGCKLPNEIKKSIGKKVQYMYYFVAILFITLNKI